jgi:hypothetical protein
MQASERLEDDPRYDDVRPRRYASEAECRANALPPILGPELAEWANAATRRALELRREADQLEEDAESCYAALDVLRNGGRRT